MHTPSDSPLGKATAYADRYDPGLLFPIPRAPKRAELGIGAALPFHGVDIWNAYELSWLDRRGLPQVALAECRVPATSPCIIESKSFKLYLNSFSQEPQDDMAALQRVLERDLGAAAGAPVPVRLLPARARGQALCDFAGDSLDELVLEVDHYGPPQPDFLVVSGEAAVEQAFTSDLLRTNCPVTGQPDWGSVQIRYRGLPIDPAGLLRYIVSFRTHSGFHEQCVEQMFVDISRRCAPESLSVYARYTRRGGLDINPFRSSEPQTIHNCRGARQ